MVEATLYSIKNNLLEDKESYRRQPAQKRLRIGTKSGPKYKTNPYWKKIINLMENIGYNRKKS